MRLRSPLLVSALLLAVSAPAASAAFGTAQQVTPGNGAFDVGDDLRLSADGTHVVFVTKEQLSSADTDASTDLYDRAGGTTTLVSAGNGP